MLHGPGDENSVPLIQPKRTLSLDVSIIKATATRVGQPLRGKYPDGLGPVGTGAAAGAGGVCAIGNPFSLSGIQRGPVQLLLREKRGLLKTSSLSSTLQTLTRVHTESEMELIESSLSIWFFVPLDLI